MDPQRITKQADAVFNAAREYLSEELKRTRTGRSSASMLDGVTVEVYGTTMPLNQLGGVSAPEPQQLLVTPYDPNNIQAITAAIRNNPSLGFNPSDDGRVVRIIVPPLTEERRREIARQIKDKVEAAMVRTRAARHEAFKQIDAAKKDKQLSEDEANRMEKTIDSAMNKVREEIESAAAQKEKEILTI